jgi:hypothetical protein
MDAMTGEMMALPDIDASFSFYAASLSAYLLVYLFSPHSW